MRWDTVFGIARAEARLARRLVRYWVFVALAFIVVMVFYLYYAFIHGFFSSYSASVGSISPKYLIAGLGLWGIVLFMVGLVFMAFDVRSRDERERIVEVLDSRPCSNLELVSGRFLGLLAMSWWPLVVTVLAISLVGWLGSTLGWPIGEPLEPWSILAFTVLMAIPALSFTLALVFLLALLLRNRLVTAVAALALLTVLVVVLFRMPIDLAPVLDLAGAYTLNFPSELVPELFTFVSVVQRAAVLAAALGLLALAAAVHPRLEGGPRKAWAASGVALLVLALAGAGTLYRQAMSARETFSTWKAAHQARRGEPAPDLQAIRGTVTIDPGRTLTADLEIDFAAPPGATLERALFSLNPGLEVERAGGGSGEALELSHRDGLLEVVLARALAAGESTTLSLRFGGAPEIAFAYLDSALRFSDLKVFAANLALLGYNPAVFHRRYVALMPGIRWLPAPGADVGRGDPDRPPDFFRLDLEVEVPEGWLVAGPGRRRQADGASPGRARYRFAPPAVLPEAALVASRFARRATEVAGVELELLLAPGHTRNLDVFAEAWAEIRAAIDERLREAAATGLPYPYDALTLVEVPTTLQAFTGGWRMDTALAPPAMLLLKESGFPTGRFDTRFRNRQEFADREGGIARAKREVLEDFFESDFNGGNVFLGAARNFFLYQTASHGTGALALDFVCHDLANRLTTGKQGFFSAHIFGPEFQQTIQSALITYLTQRDQGVTVNDAVLEAVADRPEVWDQALGVALADLDPWEDPARTVNVLALKGEALSRWILDGLGRDKAGRLLAALRARAAGRSFGHDELMAVAEELEIDFGRLAGDWLATTELPGFIASEPRLYRLGDEDGAPRYQLALHLRNDEAAPGLARLEYVLADGQETGGGDRDPWQESAAVRVPPGEAVEIGLVLSKPPQRLRVAPYLSLNRGRFAVTLPPLDEEKIVAAEPLSGARPSDWRPSDDGAIVVDDLDPGFSVVEDEAGSGLRLGGRTEEEVLDQGLPLMEGPQLPKVWSRRSAGEAWGKYRHTMAVVRAGKGSRKAVFTADLPRSGLWRLELYLLPPPSSRTRRGTYHLAVEDPSGRQELTFDAGAAEEGWNELAELEIAAGQVRLELSDETDGRAVVADAIRWRPARPPRAEEEADG